MLYALICTGKSGSLEIGLAARPDCLAAADPCGLAGLFQSVEVRASNWLINNPGV
jgi:hypothetical protein